LSSFCERSSQKDLFDSKKTENNMQQRLTIVMGSTLVAVALTLTCGCKGNQETAQTPPPDQPSATASSQPATPPPAETAAAPEPAQSSKTAATPAKNYTKELLAAAKANEKAPDTYKVKFDTTRGVFTVTVTRAWAPLGADRFYSLVKHHFYDNAAFFRVVPQFVVQFGISSTPTVSAAWKKTDIKDDPVTQTNKRGALVFATAGPNTRTTQVFINLKDNTRLDGMGFAPFGVVDGNGMNVVEMMYEGYGDSAGPDQDQLEKQGDPYLKKGWPKLDYIKSATLMP
jgi:peptidyl-prolyl cis-trans isomerase A (cyclophilin A)